jgi:hypothetical protein
MESQSQNGKEKNKIFPSSDFSCIRYLVEYNLKQKQPRKSKLKADDLAA